jgi:hypothetical protein
MHVTTRRKLGNEYDNTVLDDRHVQKISHPKKDSKLHFIPCATIHPSTLLKVYCSQPTNEE